MAYNVFIFMLLDCHSTQLSGTMVSMGYGISPCSKDGSLLFIREKSMGAVMAISVSLCGITKSNSRGKVYDDVRLALNTCNIKHFGVVVTDALPDAGATWGAGNIELSPPALKSIEAGPYRAPAGNVIKFVPKDDGIIDD